MNRFSRQAFLALIFGITGIAAAYAQTNTPRIDQREANQQSRINQGINSGALTQGETAKLQNQQNRINTAEANAKADGKVTRQERRHVSRMQNRANGNIYAKKHNANTAK